MMGLKILMQIIINSNKFVLSFCCIISSKVVKKLMFELFT